MSHVIDADKDGQVTYEEWCNWIKSVNEPFTPKNDVEKLFQTHSEFGAWQYLFFKLSKGDMEICLVTLKKHIKENDDEKVINHMNFYIDQ